MTINWDDQPLGKVTDSALAARLGVSTATVANARRGRGIEGYAPPKTEPTVGAGCVDWKAQPLGQMPDRELAKALGVKTSWVAMARRARGVPVFLAQEATLPDRGGADRVARWYSYPITAEGCRYCAEGVKRGALRARAGVMRWTDQGPCCVDHYRALPACSRCPAPVSSEGDMCDECVTRLMRAEREAGYWRCAALQTAGTVGQGDIESVRRGLAAFEGKQETRDNRDNRGNKEKTK